MCVTPARIDRKAAQGLEPTDFRDCSRPHFPEIHRKADVLNRQMKDLTSENVVDCSGAVRVAAGGVSESHIAAPGDLIFRSRGLVPTAAILRGSTFCSVVAAPLFRIRVTPGLVSPEYLLWFINHPETQLFLETRSEGTAQKMISKRTLEQLEVLIPSPEHQRSIAELAALSEREQSIAAKIEEKRASWVAARLMRFAEGE